MIPVLLTATRVAASTCIISLAKVTRSCSSWCSSPSGAVFVRAEPNRTNGRAHGADGLPDAGEGFDKPCDDRSQGGHEQDIGGDERTQPGIGGGTDQPDHDDRKLASCDQRGPGAKLPLPVDAVPARREHTRKDLGDRSDGSEPGRGR